jgi:hypothetical protein
MRRVPSRMRGLRALLVSLVLLVLLFPMYEQGFAGSAVLVVLSTAIALSGAYAASHDVRRLRLALLLAVPSVVGRWWMLFDKRPIVQGIAVVTSIALLLYVIVLILEHVLRTEETTGDEIYGAISVYILIGFTWGLAYGLVDLIFPGSIQSTHGALTPSDFLYFSFITLMTVGYGDMAPVHPATRALAIVEAMLGVIFVAVTIGRLVGVSASDRRR